MRFTFCLVAFAVTMAGCTTTSSVRPGSTAAAEANGALAGRVATVRLTDGRAVKARSVAFASDTTTWFDPQTESLVRVPTAEIASVSRRSRWGGFGDGALLGGVATALVVGVLAARDVEDSFTDYFGEGGTHVAFGAIVGVTAGAMAALPSGALGFAVGAEDRYVPLEASAAPDTVAVLGALPPR